MIRRPFEHPMAHVQTHPNPATTPSTRKIDGSTMFNPHFLYLEKSPRSFCSALSTCHGAKRLIEALQIIKLFGLKNCVVNMLHFLGWPWTNDFSGHLTNKMNGNDPQVGDTATLKPSSSSGGSGDIPLKFHDAYICNQILSYTHYIDISRYTYIYLYLYTYIYIYICAYT